jgi:cyclase
LNLLCDLSKYFGSQSIVVGMDIKKNWLGRYGIYHHIKRNIIFDDPIKQAQFLCENGVGELFIQFVDLEGTRSGYDLEFLTKIIPKINIPVIACGGAGSYENLRSVFEIGISAAAAGTMFVFHGKHDAVLLSYPIDLLGSI